MKLRSYFVSNSSSSSFVCGVCESRIEGLDVIGCNGFLTLFGSIHSLLNGVKNC